jgi:hypothetical protein
MAVNTKYNYVNVSTSGDTIVKRGNGTLHTCVINTTSTGSFIIYDGVSTAGTKIASIAASPEIGSSFVYDVEFSNGLFIDGTSGPGDITLSIG